jgi:LacI family transcriptional regulator
MSRSPYLISKSAGFDRSTISFVVNDDRYGEYLATSHLIKQGHKNIYLLVGNDNPDTIEGGMNRARIAGYRQALEEAGLPFDPRKVRYGVRDIEQSSITTKEILKTIKLPLAVCITSDYSALGVISALNQSNLRIPEEAALVGYDDIEIASHVTPQLTTISQEKYSIGSRSAEQLISMIEGKGETKQIVLQPTLVLRSTT